MYSFQNTHTSNERGNQSHASFCTSNGLAESEEKGKVTVDLVLGLKFAGSLDAFPSACDLDQDALLRDANRFIEFNQMQSLVCEGQTASSASTVEARSETAKVVLG